MLHATETNSYRDFTKLCENCHATHKIFLSYCNVTIINQSGTFMWSFWLASFNLRQYLDVSTLDSQWASRFQKSLLVSNTQSSLSFSKLCWSSFVDGQVFIKLTTLTSLCSVLQGINDNALKKDVSSFSRNMLSGLKREEFSTDILDNYTSEAACVEWTTYCLSTPSPQIISWNLWQFHIATMGCSGQG